MPQDFSPKHIREGVEASLRRLQTDYIDLYQLHSPTLDGLTQTPDIIHMLKSLQDEGKIRAYGISAKSPVDAMEAVRKYGFEVVQVNLNLIDQRALDSGLLDEVRKLGVGVIARTPLCFGYLTGNLTGNEKFLGRDHRTNWPEKQLKCWANAPSLFAHLNDGKSRSITQLALQFCLHSETVGTVIPGMMNISEVEENIGTLTLDSLTSQDFEEIRKIYKQNTFYDKSIKETILNATRS